MVDDMDLLHHYYDDDDEEEDNVNNNDDVETSNLRNDNSKRRHDVMGIMDSTYNNNNNNNSSSIRTTTTTTASTNGVTKRQRVESKKTSKPETHYNVAKATNSRIQIVTETEFTQITETQASDTRRNRAALQRPVQPTPSPQLGRWSTHCSCGITLNNNEARRAYQYVQSYCDTVQELYPTYRGYAILPFAHRLTDMQQQNRKTKKNHGSPYRPETIIRSSTTTIKETSNEPPTYHISLTRPDVALHTNHIDSFIKSLTIEIQQLSLISPFHVSFHIPTIRCPSVSNDPKHHHRTTTHGRNSSRRLPSPWDVLHNATKTKSFGIWRCTSQSSIRQLQQISNCCNRVLTQQYQQVSYHYQDDTDHNTNHNHCDLQPTTPHLKEPIYHISLVRFEPCLYEYMHSTTPTKNDATASTSTIFDPTSGDCDSNDDDDDESDDGDESEDDDDEATMNHLHYIDHVTCQFGGGAKVHHIPFSCG